MNWNLSYGGIITREIHGSPDDVTGIASNESNSYLRTGWYVGLKSQQFSKEGLFNHTEGKKRVANLLSPPVGTPNMIWSPTYLKSI